jgi:hypothetical protein
MTSSFENLESIQNLDNSALEPFSHRLVDSGSPWSLPEKGNTQFERTSSTGDLNQQSLPHRRLEFWQANTPAGPLSLEGFVPWPSPSSASYAIGSPGSSVQDCHDSSSFGCQERIAANAMEPVSGINTFEGMGSLQSISPLCYQNVGNHHATSTKEFDYPREETFHSKYQKEHSELVSLLRQANDADTHDSNICL